MSKHVQAAASVPGSGALATPADPSFDRYARLVRSALDVPIALVTIVEEARQVFPGAAGLPSQLDAERETPLEYSFCKHVVASGGPLVISDARREPQVSDNPSVEAFGIVGYAGYPLRNQAGAVIGSLCALDRQPRQWTESDLSFLEDLSAACSTEIVLRELRSTAAASAHEAWEASHRARALLSMTDKLAHTRTVTDVARAAHELAVDELGCERAGVWVVDPDATTVVRYIDHPGSDWPAARELAVVRIDPTSSIGRCVMSDEPVLQTHPVSGGARTVLPLSVRGERFGCLVLAWSDARDFSDDDQLTIGALTTAVAGAIQRAWLLDDRTSVAAQLQNALLDDLPHPPGLTLAARHRAARAGDHVGGDWYDAVEKDGVVSVIIGDVIGHDVAAIAQMGPLRTMLRTFVWERGASPADDVARLDRALGDLHPTTLSTLVLARLERAGDGHVVTWTNAGHPPPLLLHPDGRCEVLGVGSGDVLLGVDRHAERHNHQVSVASGATLVLYTDGLVDEYDDTEPDSGHDRLGELLSAGRGEPIDALLESVVTTMVGDRPRDDVAIIAVRFD